MTEDTTTTRPTMPPEPARYVAAMYLQASAETARQRGDVLGTRQARTCQHVATYLMHQETDPPSTAECVLAMWILEDARLKIEARAVVPSTICTHIAGYLADVQRWILDSAPTAGIDR